METLTEIKATIDFTFSIANRYGGILQIAWWIPLPGSLLFKGICDKYGFDDSIFDQRDWSFSESLFLKTHLWLTMENIHHIRQNCLTLASSCKEIRMFGPAFGVSWVNASE